MIDDILHPPAGVNAAMGPGGKLSDAKRTDITIHELGEKRLLRELILPMLNPSQDPSLPGDDCGTFAVPHGWTVCASTDRVPWDLTAFRLGIMDEADLGYYLAVLNISDIAAMGATPTGLLLNFALPPDFAVNRLKNILEGATVAANEYQTPILGGDLSDSLEPSLVATSLGIVHPSRLMTRSGAQPGDVAYVTGECGLTATALHYFLDAQPAGHKLPPQEESLLIRQFTTPTAQVTTGQLLAQAHHRVTAMDNTDGLGQSLYEIAEASDVHISITADKLPANSVSHRVAELLNVAVADVVLGPGADFSLVGTAPESVIHELGLHPVGLVEPGTGLSLVTSAGEARAFTPRGWDYFRDWRRK